MGKRFSNVPEHLREPHRVEWNDLPPIYWMGFGIALLVGLVTGLAWIAWRLIETQILR